MSKRSEICSLSDKNDIIDLLYTFYYSVVLLGQLLVDYHLLGLSHNFFYYMYLKRNKLLLIKIQFVRTVRSLSFC